jgi:uncharacterized protein (DUF2141 family)
MRPLTTPFLSRCALLALVALGAGCGRAEIRGSIEAPEGMSLAGAVVVACHAPRGRCEAGSRRSRAARLQAQGEGAPVPFVVSRLRPGEYIVIGLLDVNGNGVEDDGDLSGHHSHADGAAALVRPPAAGVRVHLRQVGGAVSADSRSPSRD